jgi:5'-nucleotidase
MKILVTNDDSINAKGLKALVEEAKKYGEVIVVAPFFEQSAKSHAIDVQNGIKLVPADASLNVPTYTLTSTPADCVRAAYFALKADFDIVFSGINNGLNLGEDIFYSGTVAAVTEGAMLKKRGIAFSSAVSDYESVVQNFDLIMKYFKENKLFDYNLIYNVNVPKNAKGIKLTKQGSTHFDTRFDNINGMYYQLGNPRFELDKDNEDSDVKAIYDGYISITPLNVDRTNVEVLKKLKNKA